MLEEKVKFWCEYIDWDGDKKYWHSYTQKPNWLALMTANKIIVYEENTQNYKIVKCQTDDCGVEVVRDEMQWIILQAEAA
jgi:hypothetical protein